MPVSLSELQQRCAVINGRASSDCSVHESDDDKNVYNQREEEADMLLNFATFNDDTENVDNLAKI
jgi:hypothetical protein